MRQIPKTVEVQRQRKAVPYSITVIGGASELAKWKEEQLRLNDLWQAKQAPLRAERRNNSLAVLEGSRAPLKMTDTEKAEVDYVLRRKGLIKPAAAQATKTSPPLFVPPPPVFARIKIAVAKWCRNIWKSAFQNH